LFHKSNVIVDFVNLPKIAYWEGIQKGPFGMRVMLRDVARERGKLHSRWCLLSVGYLQLSHWSVDGSGAAFDVLL
jgi:hypothetical protein